MIEKQKILLVYGIHFNETPVTAVWARQLKKTLEPKGFEVKIERIPFKTSGMGIKLEDAKRGIPLGLGDTNRLNVKTINEIVKKNPDCHIFDLHTTSNERMRSPIVMLIDPFEKRKRLNCFIEFPSITKEIQKFKDISPLWALRYGPTSHFEAVDDLRATRAANLINEKWLAGITQTISQGIKKREKTQPRKPMIRQSKKPVKKRPIYRPRPK